MTECVVGSLMNAIWCQGSQVPGAHVSFEDLDEG